MSSETPTAPPSKAMFWIGSVMSALPALMLLMSAAMKFAKPEFVVEGFKKSGYPEGVLLGLGIVELTCTILYLIPQTAVLGAILLTGYMGGAIATHLRMGEPYAFQIVFGVLIWGGLYLREPRLRAILPLRS